MAEAAGEHICLITEVSQVLSVPQIGQILKTQRLADLELRRFAFVSGQLALWNLTHGLNCFQV